MFNGEIHAAAKTLLNAHITAETKKRFGAPLTEPDRFALEFKRSALMDLVAASEPDLLDISEELMMTARVGSASHAHSDLMNRGHEEIERLRKLIT